MPTSYPRDRFDDVPRQAERVGAHRAEPPRMSRLVVFLWAALATVVLTAAGILAFLLLSQRVDILPAPERPPAAEPVIDTDYRVLILNGTATPGLEDEAAEHLTAAGWSEDMVIPSPSSVTDFPETTVYYASPDEEAVALGIAETIGGARVEQSDEYHSPEDPILEVTVVVGLDRVSGG
ncbi:LytR C-terminal domain-containing protein [Microbacterium album]|uniref:LytR/CpsA/Psr regulator C-terminal domain-containing protein n=1 Tax=Microbacterium album TaxID=2053191 RepID=A0A917IGM8_9MICO|nr:LytR C-terminal domain-containing protein [Microbacterium album]GGH43794.1 hypothetical protein GCM10010921_18020 [Microbacterium album]